MGLSDYTKDTAANAIDKSVVRALWSDTSLKDICASINEGTKTLQGLETDWGHLIEFAIGSMEKHPQLSSAARIARALFDITIIATTAGEDETFIIPNRLDGIVEMLTPSKWMLPINGFFSRKSIISTNIYDEFIKSVNLLSWRHRKSIEETILWKPLGLRPADGPFTAREIDTFIKDITPFFIGAFSSWRDYSTSLSEDIRLHTTSTRATPFLSNVSLNDYRWVFTVHPIAESKVQTISRGRYQSEFEEALGDMKALNWMGERSAYKNHILYLETDRDSADRPKNINIYSTRHLSILYLRTMTNGKRTITILHVGTSLVKLTGDFTLAIAMRQNRMFINPKRK